MRRFLRVFTSGLLILLALGSYIFYEYTLKEKLESVREKLILVASNASLSIDTDQLLRIPLNKEGDKTEEYRAVYQKLYSIKKMNPFIKFIYIMKATDRPGILQYIVDVDPLPDTVTAESPTAFPGDEYDARNVPEMLKAYSGPTADRGPTADVWGTVISGYAPLYGDTGEAVAILCVDTDGTGIYGGQRTAWIRSFFISLIVITVLIPLFLRMEV
ncbi:MAG: hypothetical protein WC515_05805 [Candidatus Omnitrophota bacterium]